MRPMLAALLAGAGLFALIARRPRSPRQSRVEDAREAERAREPPGQGQPRRAVSPQGAGHHGDPAAEERERAEARRDAREDRRWRAELAYWIISAATGAAAAGAAAFAGWYAKGAYEAGSHAAQEARRQADIAQDALVASNRPWVMLTDIKPVNLASDDAAGVVLWVAMSAKNVGHTPAQNVSVSARLTIDDLDPRLDEAMATVCRAARENPIVIPGQVIFPDQAQDIDKGIPGSFSIMADKVWAARAARIKSTYNATIAYSGNTQKAEAWANEIAKFPFYGRLGLVGCINYRSPGNKMLFQTSFMFDVSSKPPHKSIPLLGGTPPVIRYPEPAPYDPDTLMVFPRELQRRMPGDRIKLDAPLYATSAD